MKDINETLENSKSGSCTKTIRDDLKKQDMIFSEESDRVVHDMDNMELFEMGQFSCTSESFKSNKTIGKQYTPGKEHGNTTTIPRS